MATPKIGSEYRLDIDLTMRDEPISWANGGTLKSGYVTWSDIDGLIVKVKSRTSLVKTFYVVSLVDLPKRHFFVPSDFLMEITKRLPIPCSCDLLLLINRGCQCGAFKKEKEEKKNK